MTPPVLLTQRLILRGAEPQDVAPHAAMWADPEVARFIGGQPRGTQDAWFALLRCRALWDFLGYGYWIVRERRTEAFVGEVGFADFKRGMVPDLSGRPEAGWVLARSAWGKGYATEAVGAAHGWLDETHGGVSRCIINPENTASIGVAHKLGYGEVCRSVYHGADVIVFERAGAAQEKTAQEKTGG